MERELLLTCDAGTTACKCTVFAPDGQILSVARSEYPTAFPKPNWAEQSPDAVLEGMLTGIRTLLEQINPGRIACVGLSGTMNGCIPVGADGRALYPNIIHSDSRAIREIGEIAQVISPDEFYRLTGNRLDVHYTLPKILWLRRHYPEIVQKARFFLNTKDFLYGWLTGQFGVTDYSDASLTIALDIEKKRGATELLGELGIDALRMPEIRAGTDMTGQVRERASLLTGLLAGTPVAVGGGDGACAARGAGMYAPGNAYTCIGSSAWVGQLTERPVFDAGARVFNYIDMDGISNHVCGTVQCGCEASDWAIGNILTAGDEPKRETISRAENMARTVAPGAEGVLFLPTLMGERTPYWDPNTRGALLGFTLYHNRNHLARAVYEGVAYALFSCAEVMRACGVPVSSMMLIGGGANSGLWPDVLASVFEIETRVHAMPGEATSLGAAITAGVGVGLYRDFEHGTRTVQARSTHPVSREWARRYRALYSVYAQIYNRLKPLFDRLAEDEADANEDGT